MSQFKNFKDQLGQTVTTTSPPSRIISLVPSQTELLSDLGLSNEVVGVTRFCVHPSQWKESKRVIGGTKNFDFEIIHSLRPDLIIGNKEENYKAGIEKLKQDYPVWMSDINTLADALQMIRSVGEITETQSKATHIEEEISARFADLSVIVPPTLSVLYLIWRKPWMGVAPQTFIHEMLKKIGFKNSLQRFVRYPELTAEQICDLAPDYIFLSSEPFPFREKHVAELSKISPTSQILLVDGEMFSWYGSRLLKAVDYFKSLAHSLAS